MYEALKAEGIEVPFNKLEVTMLNDCFNKENGRW
jgi:small-conductance mechanosensitive channel